MLTEKTLRFKNTKGERAAILAAVEATLPYLKQGVQIEIVLRCEDDQLVRYKKRYFAMVTELSREAGYRSYKEREQYKLQIKEEIGIVSIEQIDNIEDMKDIIESVHQIASEQFPDFKFTPDATGTLFLNPGKD